MLTRNEAAKIAGLTDNGRQGVRQPIQGVAEDRGSSDGGLAEPRFANL